MFELIIYFTLAGNTDILYTADYPTGMDCTYNQGVWVQHYIEEFSGKKLGMDSADVDNDGQYDYTIVELVISKDSEVGTLDVVCVTTEQDLRVDR